MNGFGLSFPAIALSLVATYAQADSGTLHLIKECSEYSGKAGSFCTVTASNCPYIPVGSKIVYTNADLADGGSDTDLTINTPNGDVGYGHVILSAATQTGEVMLMGGTGQLAKLEGKLAVAPPDSPNYSWDGPYSY
jgi:hypothetical protein